MFLTNMHIFTSWDVNCWTGVVWIIVMLYQLFDLSFWRHPFTAEDPLVVLVDYCDVLSAVWPLILTAPIHCCGSTGGTCGLLWCFISCLASHSDGTHSLQRIHWWYLWIIVMFYQLFGLSFWRHPFTAADPLVVLVDYCDVLSAVWPLILTAPIHCRGSTGGTCGLLWCFISCLDSHSDGTHSLLRIHWWASDVMLHFSKSVLQPEILLF